MPIFGRFSEKRPPLDRNGSRPGDVKRAFLSLFPLYFAVWAWRLTNSVRGGSVECLHQRLATVFTPVLKSFSRVRFPSPVHKSRSQVDRQTVVYPFPALRKTPKQVPHDPSSR